jgi:hypothetical protein
MHGYHRRTTMSNLYSILQEMHPGGDFNEFELWEAIAEAEGVDVYDIMDGDLTEYL